MRKLGFPILLLCAAFAGGAFAQTIGGGVIVRAIALALPSVLYGPLNTNPSNTAATQPGGPLGSNALSVNTGSLNIWNAGLYGWGNSAAALCVMTGNLGFYPGASWQQNNMCPISGGVGANNNGYATYAGRDSVAAFIGNQTQAPSFVSLNGTFTSTSFVPSTPLTATQVSNLRVGMAIDTNDATPCSAVVSGWATDGSAVTVPAWYQQPGGGACTPAGTAVTINKRTKIWAMNTWTQRNAVPATDVTQATNTEMDCSNSSGVDDAGIQEAALPTPYDGCLDLVNIGANIASFGMIVRGKFNSAITINDNGLYGINLTPMTIAAGGAPIVANLITPTTSSAACTTGAIEWDASFVYICTATNTWKRATLAAF